MRTPFLPEAFWRDGQRRQNGCFWSQSRRFDRGALTSGLPISRHLQSRLVCLKDSQNCKMNRLDCHQALEMGQDGGLFFRSESRSRFS